MARTNADNASLGFTNFDPPKGDVKTTSATGRMVIGSVGDGAVPVKYEERNPPLPDWMTPSGVPGEPTFASAASMPGDPAGNQLGKGRSSVKSTKNMG
jgi:hypothetical protein